MSKEKLLREANESGILYYLLRVYGKELRKSDFEHVGCKEIYKRLLKKGIIQGVDNKSNPLVMWTEKFYQKFKLNVENVKEKLYEKN